jgi:hypothetical protein
MVSNPGFCCHRLGLFNGSVLTAVVVQYVMTWEYDHGKWAGKNLQRRRLWPFSKQY